MYAAEMEATAKWIANGARAWIRNAYRSEIERNRQKLELALGYACVHGATSRMRNGGMQFFSTLFGIDNYFVIERKQIQMPVDSVVDQVAVTDAVTYAV